MNTTIGYDGPLTSGLAPDGPYNLTVSPMPHPALMDRVVSYLAAAHPAAEFAGTVSGIIVSPKPEFRTPVLPRDVAVGIGAAMGRLCKVDFPEPC